MTQGFYEILENKNIANLVYEMVLKGDTSAITNPGQFINIKLDGFFLRRPISICDYDENTITIIYKVVGHGTQLMSTLQKGEMLDILVGLGNGFHTEKCDKNALVIGGGVGVPPMFNLAKKLIAEGKNVTAILGFNNQTDVFYEQQFKDIGAVVHVATADGTYGTKGFVTTVMESVSDYDYFFTCGPEPMLKAIYDVAKTSGELSFEERMGCGFGACMGCSCETKYGNKRICKEGPILEKEEIIW